MIYEWRIGKSNIFSCRRGILFFTSKKSSCVVMPSVVHKQVLKSKTCEKKDVIRKVNFHESHENRKFTLAAT